MLSRGLSAHPRRGARLGHPCSAVCAGLLLPDGAPAHHTTASRRACLFPARRPSLRCHSVHISRVEVSRGPLIVGGGLSSSFNLMGDATVPAAVLGVRVL